MEFRNLTPFDALCFGALDADDLEHQVIVMKVGYRLVRQDDGTWQAVVMDDEPVPLCMADEHFGEPGQSSVRQESDLAPYKPRCDVLVNGHAHAPQGRAAAQWEARVRIGVPVAQAGPAAPDAPEPLNPMMGLTSAQIEEWSRAQRAAWRSDNGPAVQARLDKTLTILGPHAFESRRLLPGWSRSAPQPIVQLPLRWEYSFGGKSRVPQPHAPDAEPLLNEVCFSNPLGRGWVEQRYRRMAHKARLPVQRAIAAPQIVARGQTLKAPVLAQNPKGVSDAAGMAEVAQGYGVAPAGFGVVGRAWAPRLALAGTYDQSWLEERHPGLPQDVDFGYWNAAPADQQIAYLPPSFRLEAWHLTPDATTGGYVCVDLPAYRPFVLMRMESGVMLPLPMVTDTVIFDSDALTVTLTHRSWIPAGTPPIRALEARFETDPDAPLIKTAPTRAPEEAALQA